MLPLGLFQDVGITELLIILFIVLLLFGSTKLPQLARALGSSVKEFKKGAREEDEDEKKPEGGEKPSGEKDSKEKAKSSSAEKN
jgi:sec-independent protein translocase protein TatA